MLKIILCCIFTICASSFACDDYANLGITVQEMNHDMLESQGLQGKNGVIITEIAPNSPAKSILKQGDVIIGKNLTKSGKAELTIWRENKSQTVVLDANLKPKNNNLLADARFAETKKGVVVTQPGTSGFFENGDVVLEINRQKIHEINDIANALKTNRSGITVKVARNDGSRVTQSIAVDENGSIFRETIVEG